MQCIAPRNIIRQTNTLLRRTRNNNGPYTRYRKPVREVRVNGVGDVVRLDIHVDQLRQIEIHIGVRETKHTISYVRLDARFLGVEQVGDSDGHVKHLRLK